MTRVYSSFRSVPFRFVSCFDRARAPFRYPYGMSARLRIRNSYCVTENFFRLYRSFVQVFVADQSRSWER